MTWDYIVVGGGSAGCVIASRLSENPQHRVLLLEAGLGGLDKTPIVSAPAGAFHVYNNKLFDWCYRAQPDPSCAGRAEAVYGGKLLGGGSSINGMMFIRGNPQDFDEWANLGNDGWAYRDVLPFFKKIERTHIGTDGYHGRQGPLGVDFATPMLDISHRFIEAAVEAGVNYNSDINGASLEGVSRTPCSVYEGVRQSTARGYLRPAMKRPNLTVRTRALVQRVVFEGKQAVGVEYACRGGTEIARASKEVVLCAGGVRSPHILLLSGVGPAEQLRQFDIPVVHELPGVGENYMDHAACHTVFEVTLPTWSREVSLGKQAIHGLRWVLRKEGPAQSGVSQAVAFVRTAPSLDQPDIQITLLPIYLGKSEPAPASAGSSHKRPPEKIMIYVDECKPTSRGRLALASAKASDAPLVFPNLLGGEGTIQKLIAGIQTIRRIMSAGAIGSFVTREITPGPLARSDEEIERWIRSAAVSMAHPSGTCKMGPDDDCVVDAKLRVKGVKGLRVADASIMPTMPSGNINAPTIMIGERAAALIAEG